MTADEVRARVRETVGQGAEIVGGQIPFTPRATRTLELSLREALARGDNYIGPEHILFGLLRAAGGGGPGEWDEELLRDGVRRLLAGPGDRPQRGPRAHAAGIAVRRSRPAIPPMLVAAPVLVLTAIVLVGLGLLVGWLIWGH